MVIIPILIQLFISLSAIFTVYTLSKEKISFIKELNDANIALKLECEYVARLEKEILTYQQK